MENKRIIGYKLFKPEYANAVKAITNIQIPSNVTTIDYIIEWFSNKSTGRFIDKLISAKVLDLWFTPIYEENFKVGDFIALEYNTHNFCAKKGYIAKVIKEFDGKYISIKWITETDQIDGKYSPSNFRKATPIEVQTAQTKVITMYSSNKGEFEIEVIDGNAYYKPENKELSKEFIEVIIKSFKDEDLSSGRFPYNIKTKTFVDVGCMHNTKKEDWEKVYKLLK